MADPIEQAAAGMAHLLIRKAQMELRSAESRLAHANDLRTVVQLKDTQVSSLVRSVLRREMNALERKAEERAKTIVKGVLTSIEGLEGEAQRTAVVRAQQQFMLLRGHFPRLSGQADRHLILLRQKAHDRPLDEGPPEPVDSQAPPRERP